MCCYSYQNLHKISKDLIRIRRKSVKVADFQDSITKKELLSPKRVKKLIGLLRKVQNVLPRTFKLLVRPHHAHGDIAYEHKSIKLFFFIKK